MVDPARISMKFRNKLRAVAVLVVGAGVMVAAQVMALDLDYGGDLYVGYITPDHPSGEADELAYDKEHTHYPRPNSFGPRAEKHMEGRQ